MKKGKKEGRLSWRERHREIDTLNAALREARKTADSSYLDIEEIELSLKCKRRPRFHWLHRWLLWVEECEAEASASRTQIINGRKMEWIDPVTSYDGFTMAPGYWIDRGSADG